MLKRKHQKICYGGVGEEMTETGNEEGTISKIFNGLFLLICVFACLMILMLFIISILNIVRYKNLKKEYDNAMKYNQVILKDTLDYKLLSYTGGLKSEPLLIDSLITITNIIFILIGSYVLLICLEMGILIGLSIYGVFKGGNTMNLDAFLKVKFYKVFSIILAISLVGTYTVYDTTKKLYLEKTLPALLDTKTTLYNLKQSIIPNLYIDKDYLEALRNDDVDKIKMLVKTKITSGDIETTAKMIFTYDIYEHYQEIFTVSDSIREEIKNKFKPEILKGTKKDDSFEPADYLIYTDEDIQLLIFGDSFINVIVRDDTNLQTSFGNKLTEVKNKVDIYLKNVNNISKNINKTVLEENTNALVEYIYNAMYYAVFAFVLVLATLIGILFNYPIIKDAVFEFIGKVWSKIVGFVKSIFGM